MSNDSRSTVGPLTRRSTLQTLGTLLAGAGVAGTAGADPGDQYTIVQGDATFTVEPLSGDVPVEQFYGFRLPDGYEGVGVYDGGDGPFYGSTGTRALQRESTTITFLYDGPNGLSLVVVHDRAADEANEGDDGGSASWDVYIHDADADWIVRDDEYWDADTGEYAQTNYDEWDTDGVPHQIDWTWAAGGTDGGVLGHLGEATALLIDPSYNEDAALYGQHYEGDVTGWQFLTGSLEDPDRVSLALDTPLAVLGPSGDLSAVTGGELQGDDTEETATEETTTEESTETESSGEESTDPEATDEETATEETTAEETTDRDATEDGESTEATERDDGDDDDDPDDDEREEIEEEIEEHREEIEEKREEVEAKREEIEAERGDDSSDLHDEIEEHREEVEEKREAIEEEIEDRDDDDDDDGPGLGLGRGNGNGN